ncbi:MAG: hypothetical protein AAFR27_00720 [Pseudomonadota bacterium]
MAVFKQPSVEELFEQDGIEPFELETFGFESVADYFVTDMTAGLSALSELSSSLEDDLYSSAHQSLQTVVMDVLSMLQGIEQDPEKSEISFETIMAGAGAISDLVGDGVVESGAGLEFMSAQPIAMLAGATPNIMLSMSGGPTPPVNEGEVFEFIRLLMREIGRLIPLVDDPDERALLKRFWDSLNQIRAQLGRMPPVQVLLLTLQYLYYWLLQGLSKFGPATRRLLLEILKRFIQAAINLLGYGGGGGAAAGGAAAGGGGGAAAAGGGLTAGGLALILAQILIAFGVGVLIGKGILKIPTGGGKTVEDWVVDKSGFTDLFYDWFYKEDDTCSKIIDRYLARRRLRRMAERGKAPKGVIAARLLEEAAMIDVIIKRKCLTGVQLDRIKEEKVRLEARAKKLLQ